MAASFDRSAVENEVRYSLGYNRGDVEYRPSSSAVNSETVSVYGYNPQQQTQRQRFLAKTSYGTYYGAAANPWFLATLPQKNREDFPQTKAEVQSKPQGISVYNARLEYLKSVQTPSLKSAKDFKIVCYYGGWSVYRKSPMAFGPENIDPFMCTHLIYSFTGLEGNKMVTLDNEADVVQGGYQKALDLKKVNPDLKVMIAIGGWNEGVKKYSQMASSKSNRMEFIESVIDFLNQYGFDGLDVDWEYPGDTERGGGWSDTENYASLLEELREAFDGKNWLLTAAVPAPKSRIDPGYDVKRVAKALDFINVMTYDLHGTWDGFADHHAPLYAREHDWYPYNTLTVDYAMNYWHQKGAPKDKLIMGVPFYGRSFLLQDASKYQPGQSAKSTGGFKGPFTDEEGFLAYYEICKLAQEPGWVQEKDGTGNVFMHNDQKWIGYDTKEAIERKMYHIRANGFGGGMTWAIDLDDFNGVCGDKWPLLTAMNAALKSEKPVPQEDIIASNEQENVQESSSSSSQSFDCPGAGTFPSATDCSAYFQCTADGTSYAHQCPAGLHFNKDSKICDWPKNVQCSLDQTTKTTSKCSYKSNGLYSEPTNCQMAYWCIDGNEMPVHCPISLYFDPVHGNCNFYAAYRCSHGSQQYLTYMTHPTVPLRHGLLDYSLMERSRVNAHAYKAPDEKRVVCYFANWAQLRQGKAKYVPENINAELCTHIFYAFANLDSASFEAVPGEVSVDINDGYYNRLQSVARKQNPEVKIILSLGGWTDSSGDKYSRLVNDKDKRRHFVQAVTKMLKTRKFDGLSLEWQFPVCWQSDCTKGNKKDQQGYLSLIKALKSAFKPHGLILAAGLSGYSEIAKNAYNVQEMAKHLDMANVYAYDYHGYWDRQTGHHSPLKSVTGSSKPTYNVEYIMNYYSNKGFAKSQLNVGVPFYGQSFTLSSSSKGVGAPASSPGNPGDSSMQPGMMTFFEICHKVKNQNWSRNKVANFGAYASKGDQWVSYNDLTVMGEKAKFINQNGYGGVAVYTMDMDDFNNQCCHGPNPLLNVVNKVLRGKGQISQGNCQAPAPVTTPAPPETTTGYEDGGANQWKPKPWKPANSTPKPQNTWGATTTKRTTTTQRTTSVASGSVSGSGDLKPGKPCNTAGNTFTTDNCQDYYICVNKKLVKRSCTVGLLWDGERCNWANLVQCGTRTVDSRDSLQSTTEVVTTTTVTEEVETESCNPGEYQAVPGICNAYKSCNTNGHFQQSYCSEGLHWSQETLSCTWASESTCQSDPSLPSVYVQYYKSGQSCSNSGKLVANPDDCGSFLICNIDQFIVQPCASGLHWDSKISACNTIELAGCQPGKGDVSQGSGSQTVTTEATPASTTTQWEWKPDNDNNNGQWKPDTDQGQWEWKPPTTTTTETTFIETSNVAQPLSGDYKVVCYFTNWAWYRPGIGKYKPEDIDPTICTHVVYGFAVLDGSRLLIKPHDTWADLDNDFYKKVLALKKKGIKVTIAIGGWNDSLGSKYSNLVNNPAARAKFVKHVVDFIEEHGFDGLDLDWEYPKCWQVDCSKGPDSDKEAFALWVKELKEAFKPKGYLLSAAVSPSKKVMDLGYDIPSIARDLDWIAVMSYDYHGHWDKKTGHVSPMYAHPEDDYDYFNTDFTMRYWVEKGAPANKLVMGMPLYGQAFTLNSADNHGLNAPANQKGQAGQFTRAAGFLAYYEICDMVKNGGYQVVEDPQGRLGPYAHKDKQWVGYDDKAMIKYKSEYIRRMGFAGGMVWALDLDDFRNRCGEGHHPLMNTIKEVLGPKMTDEEEAARINGPPPLERTPNPPSDEQDVVDIRQDGNLDGITDKVMDEKNVMPKITVVDSGKKVVCYFTNWAFYRPGVGKFEPEDINVELCTHIVYGFAVLNPKTLKVRAHDSWVDFDKEFYKRVSSLKGTKRKVSLALGGWNDSKGNKYSKLVNDPQARAAFIDHIVPFLKKHNFDGLDLDWEYPKCWQVDCKKGPASDKDGFADWVKELSVAFKPEGLILSSAMSPSAKVCDEAYDIPKLNRYFDFVSVMTYDYHGQWDKQTGHVAPIYEHPDSIDPTFNVNYTINYWLDKGMDKSKLIMGLPLYGQSFTLASKANNGLNSKTYGGASAGKYTRSRGFYSYYEICDKVQNKGWEVVRDPTGKMGPYAFKNREWVSFDDVDTIEEKMKLLKEYDLGGAMIWALDLDDFNNQCGSGTYPLLKTINAQLGRLSSYQRPALLKTDTLRAAQVEENLDMEIEAIPYQQYWHYNVQPWYRTVFNYNPKK